MNKKQIFIFALFLMCTSLFADKNTFLKSPYNHNGKIIDWLYVDATDGLNVRVKGNLSATKITGLPHRMKVKPVAVGKAETIDGISDYWVEILIPRYLWKSDVPEYGWVFGGYLKGKKPEFTTEGWTKNNLFDFLTSYLSWAFYDKYSEWIGYMHFNKDGTFSEIHPSPSDPGYKDSTWSDGKKWYGTWKVLSANSFYIEATEKNSGATASKTVIIKDFYSTGWKSSPDGKRGASLFSDEPTDGCAVFEEKTIRDGSILKSKSLYMGDFWGEVSFGHYNNDENFKAPPKLLHEFVKAGIKITYDCGYDDYWNPIIEEHMNRD